MTRRQQRETNWLRLCREAFQRAIADGVTVEVGRQRVLRDRWAEANERLQRRRCGTAAPLDGNGGGERPLQWWQRD